MFILKKVILILLPFFFIACDDLISLDSEFTYVDFVKYESSKKIIVKTNKFCDSDDIRHYTKIFYRDENNNAKYIKVTDCKNLNKSCTKFLLTLKDPLNDGIKYTVYNDQKYFICYFDFEYKE